MNTAQNTGIDITTLAVGILTFLGLLANLAWSVYSFRQQRKDANENLRQLNNLQQEMNKTNRLQDQKTQRIHRAIEALNKITENLGYLDLYVRGETAPDRNTYSQRMAKAKEGVAELGGIASAINDETLTNLISGGLIGNSDGEDRSASLEVAIKVHARLTTMLEEIT